MAAEPIVLVSRSSTEPQVTPGELTCEIVDYGSQVGGLPVRLSPPEQAGGRGLWPAHQLTDTLVLTRRPDGVTASPVIRWLSNAGTGKFMNRNEGR
ncbi:hypothetical protein GCM10010166_63660 [Couchioplanes caeruleus subsp. azureus]|nr:hypothetical protein GCM10010166_63660 [Couchioplanes caeruleus subsp. azureus]